MKRNELAHVQGARVCHEVCRGSRTSQTEDGGWEADGNEKQFFRPYVDVPESDDSSEQTSADDDVDFMFSV